LHLVFEHEVEGRAEQTAERGDLFGQATDPEIDAAETGGRDAVEVLGGVDRAVVGPGSAAAEEVGAIGIGHGLAGDARGVSAVAAARLSAVVVADVML